MFRFIVRTLFATVLSYAIKEYLEEAKKNDYVEGRLKA